MKKVLVLIGIFLLGLTLVACQEKTTTTTTKSIAEIMEQLDNPYNIVLSLTETPLSSMGINFELPSELEGFVEFKEIGASQYTRIEATKKVTLVRRTNVYLYEAIMTGLEAGKTYIYRIGSTDQTAVSEDYQFTIQANANESFTFMYLADPQENTETGYMAYANTVLHVLEYSKKTYDFVAYVGDIVNDADIRSQWNNFFKYSSFFLMNKPIVATAGNHEVPAITNDRIISLEYDGYFNFPKNGPVYEPFEQLVGDKRQPDFDKNKTYSFDYGNAHMVFLNSELICDGTTACSTTDEVNLQILKNWLIADLTQNTKPWTIVFLHRGPYGLSYDTHMIRTHLVPIFDEFGVDLVITGHEHQYSRAIYKGGELQSFGESDAYSKGNLFLGTGNENRHFNHYSSTIGTTYLVSNTVGTKFYGGSRSSGLSVNFSFSEIHPVVSFLTVTAEGIRVSSYAATKTSAFQIEPDNVYLLEEFYITK